MSQCVPQYTLLDHMSVLVFYFWVFFSFILYFYFILGGGYKSGGKIQRDEERRGLGCIHKGSIKLKKET